MKKRSAYTKPTVARFELRVEEPVLAICLATQVDPFDCEGSLAS